MASVSLTEADNKTIVAALAVGALGFYLAVSTENAIRTTVEDIVPSDNKTLAAWISLVIAVFIVILTVYIIMKYVLKK